MSKMTAKQWEARGWVYSDLADRLNIGDEYDCPIQSDQGIVLAKRFDAEAQKCWDRAKDLREVPL